MIKIYVLKKKKRAKKINHDFEVCSWICSSHNEIGADVKARFKKNEDEGRVNNVTKKHHANIPDVDISEIHDKFWKEWKIFKNEDGVCEKRNMWNVNDARMGKSAE